MRLTLVRRFCVHKNEPHPKVRPEEEGMDNYSDLQHPPEQPLQLPEQAFADGQPMHFCPAFFAR